MQAEHHVSLQGLSHSLMNRVLLVNGPKWTKMVLAVGVQDNIEGSVKHLAWSSDLCPAARVQPRTFENPAGAMSNMYSTSRSTVHI